MNRRYFLAIVLAAAAGAVAEVAAIGPSPESPGATVQVVLDVQGMH